MSVSCIPTTDDLLRARAKEHGYKHSGVFAPADGLRPSSSDACNAGLQACAAGCPMFDSRRWMNPAPTVRLDQSSVDHPPHYQANGVEAMDVIEAFGLGFCLGNVVKYVLRSERKGAPLVDLKKALWYLDREIQRREKP